MPLECWHAKTGANKVTHVAAIGLL
jgi:hypothetical protein